MKVVRPTMITEAMLTASSIAENDYDAWTSGSAYAKGARVVRLHSIYEAVSAVTANKPPESNSDVWLFVMPTNRWAMFDRSVGTLSTAPNSISVTISPGPVDTLALLEVEGLSATATMKVSGVPVWTRTLSTAAGGAVIDNWFDYFFAPVGTRNVLVFDDLPVYSAGVIDVTIDAGTGTASLSTLVVGRQFNLGTTEISASISNKDFSRREDNAFGTTMLVERAWSKKMNVRALLPTGNVDAVQRELAKLRATPALWIGDESFDALVIYGFYTSFALDLATEANSYCTLAIEGLISS